MSRRMKFTSGLFLLALLSLCPHFLLAQAAGTQAQPSGASQSKGKPSVSVTGCLKAGSEKGGYYIAGKDGKVYELIGKSVDLSPHVNHTVTISGHEAKLSDSHESALAEHEKTESAGKPYADLQVSSLKMVSESCTP